MSRPLLLVALVGVTAISVFVGTLGHGFVWDDGALILENRYLRDGSEIGRNLTLDFFRRSEDASLTGYWRPVVTLSYMRDLTLFGGRAWGFHLVNVLLHSVASALLFLVTRRLSGSDGLALAAAVLFAVHPAHAESVAWISGRTDLYCGVWFLAAVLFDLENARRPRRLLRVLALLATAFSVLSKEVGVVLPLVVALRALVWPDGRGAGGSPVGRALRASLPHGLLVAAYFGLRFAVLHIPAPGAGAGAGASRWIAFLTWWSAFLEYLRVLIWPMRLDVDVFLPLQDSPLAPRVVAGVLAFGATAAAAWFWRRREPVVAFGLGWFLVALLPLTHFVLPVRSSDEFPFPWAERFVYVPSMGLCIAAAWLLLRRIPEILAMREARPERRRRLAVVIPAALVTLLGVGGAWRTSVRARDWKNDLTLFGAAVRTESGRFSPHLNLGIALAEAGRFEEAEEQYRLALSVRPDSAKGTYNLGNLYLQRGDLARAETSYRRALEINPSYAQAHLNLGIVLLRTNRTHEALAAFEAADEALEDHVNARINRAHTMRLLGLQEEAIPLYRQALELEPGRMEARLGLGGALVETGRDDEGEAVLRGLLADRPDLVPARLVLAGMLDRAGRTAEAREQYRRILRLQPGNAEARSRLGL